MAVRRIQITRKLGGVESSATAMTLSNPEGTWGLRREDNGAIVLPVGTVVPLVAPGLYELEVPDLAENTTYEYWIRRDADGRFKHIRGTLSTEVAEPGEPASPFHTYQEFLDKFGEKNVASASNKDRDTKSVNQNAVAIAFATAQNLVEDYFRDSAYEVPFDFTPNGGTVPYVLKNWALTLAYGELYLVRGFQDDSPKNRVSSKVSQMVKDTWLRMARYKGGIRRMLVANKAGVSSGPSVFGRSGLAEYFIITHIADASPVYRWWYYG
jgi:hypothetical protein